MIYHLDGMFETPSFKKDTHMCLYHNNLCEDYPPHWHSPIELLVPIVNSYQITVNGQDYNVKPYELLFIASGAIHSTVAPESGHRYFFQIDISRLKDIYGINSVLSFMGPAYHVTPENMPDIHRQLVKIFEEICDEYYNSVDFENPDAQAIQDASLSQDIKADSRYIPYVPNTADGKYSLCEPIIYAKLLTMFTLIGRNHLKNIETESLNQAKKMEYYEKFLQVTKYIDEHFTEDLSLEEISAKAGFSKFHFSRLFKQFTNISFYKYVNTKRISHAEDLLASSELSITQVAIQSGFSSTSSFIRMFKQLKNCTPTDFRKIREQYSFRSGNRIPTSLLEESINS